jgi:hypothetical protein
VAIGTSLMHASRQRETLCVAYHDDRRARLHLQVRPGLSRAQSSQTYSMMLRSKPVQNADTWAGVAVTTARRRSAPSVIGSPAQMTLPSWEATPNLLIPAPPA